MGKPAVPVVTNRFTDLVKAVAQKKGMPRLRFAFVPHPVYGKTPEQHQAYVEGKDPVSGRPLMQEIVDALTQPLSEEEKKTGFMESNPGPRLIGPQTADNLQRLFRANGWTDYLPVILPTEQKVAEMLRGTSHAPDEIVGKLAGGNFEPWQFTVEKVAINAVMAGAKPEYFPLILAIAASGIPAFYGSADSTAGAILINGPIREEISMNFEIGAMGPFNQANATIGRAWNLITRNLGNGGAAGETYLGSLGNSLNYTSIVVAENEGSSPWQPLSLQKGFKAGESVVSIFTGLGIHSGQGAKRAGAAKPLFDRQFSSILNTFTGYYGALIVCDPLVAKDLKVQGYDTKEKLSDWLQKNIRISVADYRDESYVAANDFPQAAKGIQPYASWSKLPDTAMIPRFASPKDINIVVAGGETQASFQAGNLKYITSISIDKWR
jgi:hypothetical protein